MKFAHPEWILVVWLLAIFVAGALFLLYKRHLQIIAWLPVGVRFASPTMRTFLRGFLGLFLLVAWLDPKIQLADVSEKQVDKVVWYVLDVSASMQTQDVLPSRVTFAREAIIASIKRLKGAQVGIILFSSSAIVQVPLTYDRVAALQVAKLISGYELSSGPAHFRQALLLVHKRTESAARAEQKAVNVVFLSDGETNPENYASVLHRFKKNGSVIWPVAIATETGGVVPNLQRSGDPIISKLELSGFEAIKNTFEDPISIVSASPEKALLEIEKKFVHTTRAATGKQEFSLRNGCLLLAIGLGIAVYVFRPIKAI